MVIFLMFLVSIPALTALGHDAWLYYNDQSRPFEFADLGFIWTKYDPESYRTAIEQIDPETWANINYFLTFEAFYVGIAFAVFFYIIIGLFSLLKPASGEKKPKIRGKSALNTRNTSGHKRSSFDQNYGGFWIRVVASIIDGIILGIVIGIIALIVFKTLGLGTSSEEVEAVLKPHELLINITCSLLYVLYWVAFEISPLQATPGKLLFGMKIQNTQGERISFLQAIVRNIVKYIISPILCIGYIMVAFTQRKQGLHDLIAKTVVYRHTGY
jgi:uncharacterized RDD family membrane protein YckC